VRRYFLILVGDILCVQQILGLGLLFHLLLCPVQLHFTWDAISAAESSLNTGSLLYTEDYSLDLSGAVQLDWTEQQMEQQTETEYLLDAENIPDED
jgi:hypothetical protein